jgi:arylsulfatase A-like enzyme
MAMLAAACGGGTSAPEAQGIRLVDLFRAEVVRGTMSKARTIPRIEWRFDQADANTQAKDAPKGWEASPAVSGASVKDGRLTGRTASEFPLLRFERTGDFDNRDQFHSVEIRMKASAGATVSVATRGPGPVPFDTVERGLRNGPFQMSVALTPGDEFQTYTLTSPQPLPASRVRHILVRPTDAAGATFEIETVRLVLRKEHLATMASGVNWQGLGEIYRESLVSRVPETLAFNVTLPERPWLDLGIGSVDDGPVTFRVAVKAGGAAEQVLHEQTVTTPYRWERVSIDLESLAGRAVELSLSLAGETSTIGLWGSPAIRSRPGRAWDEDRPQGVILIHADTLRPDHMSMYGAKRDTAPFLKRLASEGVLFNRAMAQATWTKVSSPSFLASLYPTTHGVARFTDRLPASVTTLADVYRAAGHATLSLSSVTFTGQFTNLHKGFEEVHEATSQSDPQYDSKTAREYVGRTIDWIERHRDEPFFIYLHVFDPHSPFEPRRPYDSMWADPTKRDEHLQQRTALGKVIADPGMASRGMATREEMAKAGVDAATYLAYDKDWYDGSIKALDVEIERLYTRLRMTGLDRKTAVVFLSDHGEEFHEHGRMWHGQSAYGELAHVPLFLRWPAGIPAGRPVDELVQLIDVMPTLLDLSGLPHPEGMQGQSLVPLLQMPASQGTAWKKRPAITEKQPMRGPNDRPDPANERDASWQSFAIHDGEWKLIHHTIRPAGKPEFELFDALRDPLDQKDLASAHPDVVERLKKALDGWQQMALAARPKSDSEATQKLSPEQLQRLRSLGYVK